jgi:dTDP-4-amino-4,6-dideoxygalactose transaminase
VVAGATPVFADIDFDSQNITADSISEAVTPRTKAIIAVHLAGWPCDMPGIMDVAKRHNLFVIEDCAQAHGARIDGKYVGTFGDVAAFSFCQDKIMSTAGEGGMLLTNDKDLWAAAWSFKDHGKSWEKVHSPDHPLGFRWLHDGFGSNYRMTEIEGAIGRIQLRKLDSWVSCRRKNAGMLIRELEGIAALRVPRPGPGIDHAYYRFYVFAQPQALDPAWSRDRILQALAAEGIPGLSGSCPEIYREAAFEDRVHPRCPVAKELGVTSIALLVHPTLDKSAMDCQATALKKVLALATRKVP